MARSTKPAPPLEKHVQRVIIDLFKRAGFKVRSTSQYRASHVDPDLPDLYCTHAEAGLWCWFEVKRLRAAGWAPNAPHVGTPDPLRPGQAAFAEECFLTDQPHFWGGIREAEEALVRMGRGYWRGGVFYLNTDRAPTPRPRSVRLSEKRLAQDVVQHMRPDDYGHPRFGPDQDPVDVRRLDDWRSGKIVQS